ncbi:MAG: hypothetical protein V1876_03430, partial [Candidatus Peregrinibacteria bacterium]
MTGLDRNALCTQADFPCEYFASDRSVCGQGYSGDAALQEQRGCNHACVAGVLGTLEIGAFTPHVTDPRGHAHLQDALDGALQYREEM